MSKYKGVFKLGTTNYDKIEVIHFQPFNDNGNVRCLHGSAHAYRSKDITKVNCPKCLDEKTCERFWFEHEQKHGNVNKNFK